MKCHSECTPNHQHSNNALQDPSKRYVTALLVTVCTARPAVTIRRRYPVTWLFAAEVPLEPLLPASYDLTIHPNHPRQPHKATPKQRSKWQPPLFSYDTTAMKLTMPFENLRATIYANAESRASFPCYPHQPMQASKNVHVHAYSTHRTHTPGPTTQGNGRPSMGRR